MKKEPRKLPGEVYTKEQINLILKAISKRCPTGIRNRALIVTLYGAGARISEALDLAPNDVNLDSGKITIRRGKGGKYRIVGIPESLCGIIQIWMDMRKRLGIHGRGPLFCTITTSKMGRRHLTPGGKMSPDYVRGALSRVAKKIDRKTGNRFRVHSHGFRHTMASELVGEGHNIIEVQDQLGHANLNTTQKYIKKIAPEQLVNRMYTRKCTLEV